MIGRIKINPIITIPDFRRSPWSHHFPLTDASGAVSWMSIQCWIVWHLFGLEFLSQGSVFFTDFVSIDFVTFGHMLVLLLVVSTISVFYFLKWIKELTWTPCLHWQCSCHFTTVFHDCTSASQRSYQTQLVIFYNCDLSVVSNAVFSLVTAQCSPSTVVTVSGLSSLNLPTKMTTNNFKLI